MRDDGMHQIGEAAGRVGLSLRTVRYYEEVGLVVPSGRTVGGFRLYTERDIERLALVKQLKPLEFVLDELRQLMELRDQIAQEDDPDVRAGLLERLDGYADAAAERCNRLRDQLEQVQAVTDTLRREVHAGRRRRSNARRGDGGPTPTAGRANV